MLAETHHNGEMVLRELGLGNMGFEMRMRTKVKRLFEIANVWVVRKKYGIRFPTL